MSAETRVIVADSIDLSCFKFLQPRQTRVFWNRVHNDPSRSSKVIDFGTDQKRVYDFLFDLNGNLLVAWLSGNALVSINEVTLRQARLVLGWVTVCERVNHLGM